MAPPERKVRTEVRLDPELHRWMEDARQRRGWDRTQVIELALFELRRHGLPQELPAELTRG